MPVKTWLLTKQSGIGSPPLIPCKDDPVRMIRYLWLGKTKVAPNPLPNLGLRNGTIKKRQINMAAGVSPPIRVNWPEGQQVSKRFEDISDPTERKVLEALADPLWDFRTISGISKETGLTPAEIKKALDAHPDLVRQSLVPDRHGRSLYTLRERPIKLREKLALLQIFVTKSIT